MRFDRLTVALLAFNADAPALRDAEMAALQDGHLAHLAALHDAGYLLSAGPLAFDDPDAALCGLSIFKVGVEEARALAEQDPAVRAGLFTVRVLPWMVPDGLMAFTRAHLPRSRAEAAPE